ncbi:MAG: hypothetical protein JWQ29_1087 [Phenylobacterium sp.]|nr:hypothetical protein [Phenylobacterium sp.]
MSPEDLAALRRAAEAGDAEATAFTAVLAALGAWEPQSWPEALRRLARAAGLGSRFAGRQLELLEDEAAGLAAPFAPPPKVRLRPDPRISSVPGFLSPPVCAWLIERARGRLAPAQVFDPEGGGARREEARTNSAVAFALEDLDVVLLAVRARIAAATGMPTGALEPVQILHYAPGQAFDRHYDFLDPETPAYAADLARSGQRAATFLVYLNDGYGGGETDFPRIGLRHRGRGGDALMFANVDRAGAPDRRMLHAGLPPSDGEKWLLSQWIRDRAPA